MKILSGKESSDSLKDIVYLKTQTSEQGIDLTVSKIYEIKNRGEIDFGGEERKDAEIEEIEPKIRNPEDDYGWWELNHGTYLIEYNEKISREEICFLQPLKRLTRNSATIPSRFVSELGLDPLYVGEEGIAIKENSRVCRLLIVKSENEK